MSASFSHEQIAASLYTDWEAAAPAGVAVIYPGMKLDTSAIGEWIELAIENWSRRPQRHGARERVRFVLVVRIFVRPTTNKGRAQELADDVREALSQQSYVVRDFDASGSPVLGHLRLDEPETRDLSRMHLQSTGTPLQQMQLSFRGTAEET